MTTPGSPHIAGYADPWVVSPGARLAFRIGAPGPLTGQGRVVRIICASREPGGPAERQVDTDIPVPATIDLFAQALAPGSGFLFPIPPGESCSELTLGFGVQPARPAATGHLVSFGRGASRVVVELVDGAIAVTIGTGPRLTGMSPAAGQWAIVRLSIDAAAGRATLRLTAIDQRGSRRTLAEPRQQAWQVGPRPPFELDGVMHIAGNFNGRLDTVVLADGQPDLDDALFTNRLPSCVRFAPTFTGAAGFQSPITAVRGMRWDGTAFSPHQRADHYSAAHFNADSLTDACWRETVAIDIPPDTPSGLYALRIEAAGLVQHISFLVSACGRPRARIAWLAPTYSYLAYANAPAVMRGPVPIGPAHENDLLLDRVRPAYGRSLYERHLDGMGVHFSSDRRPLLNASPGNRPWGLVADTLLTDWLDRQQVEVDLITDHDLHRLGKAALAPYQVVLTGNHPEYVSTHMWDGIAGYLDGGGRLMYLGGNGFYARIGVSNDGRTIEARRAEDGTRPYIAEPGEYTLATSGEYGGMWRRLGRPPQMLVGVGTAAQGFVRSTHYRRLTDATAPEVGWVFDGVDGATIGSAGVLGGGASGYEIDRFDTDLGSPGHAWVLATSEGHDPSMLRSKEELLSNMPPFADRKARSDLVLMAVGDAGGAVFSVGSMTWVGSLGVDAGVDRVTRNVLRRFLDPAPLPRKLA